MGLYDSDSDSDASDEEDLKAVSARLGVCRVVLCRVWIIGRSTGDAQMRHAHGAIWGHGAWVGQRAKPRVARL